MLISIAMATRNSERTLPEALDSVKAALTPAGIAYEVLVADGASSDRTCAISSAFPHARIVSHADGGLYDGMNRAIAAAAGDLVIILNSDDILLETGVRAAVSRLVAAPDSGMVSGAVLIGRSLAAATRLTQRHPLTAEGIVFGIPAINARVYRSALLRRAGPIRTDIGLGADREFLLRVLAIGPRGLPDSEPCYFYRSHLGSQTISDDGAGRARVYRSDTQLALALLADPTTTTEVRRHARALHGLAKLKTALRGSNDTDRPANVSPESGPPAMQTRVPHQAIDSVRGLIAYARWRGALSGY